MLLGMFEKIRSSVPMPSQGHRPLQSPVSPPPPVPRHGHLPLQSLVPTPPPPPPPSTPVVPFSCAASSACYPIKATGRSRPLCLFLLLPRHGHRPLRSPAPSCLSREFLLPKEILWFYLWAYDCTQPARRSTVFCLILFIMKQFR